MKKNRIHHQHLNVWERNYRDSGAKIRRFMGLTKQFLEKVFSTKRMERYFALYPDDEARAIRHYECNLMLAESLYVSLSVQEVTLRNTLCRELETMTGRFAAGFSIHAPMRTAAQECVGTTEHVPPFPQSYFPQRVYLLELGKG